MDNDQLEALLDWGVSSSKTLRLGNQEYTWDPERGWYFSTQTGDDFPLVAYAQACPTGLHDAPPGVDRMPMQAPGPVLIDCTTRTAVFAHTFGGFMAELVARWLVGMAQRAHPGQWYPLKARAVLDEIQATAPEESMSLVAAGLVQLIQGGYIAQVPDEQGNLYYHFQHSFVRGVSFFCRRPWGAGPMQGSLALLELNTLRWACAAGGKGWFFRRGDILRTPEGEPYGCSWALYSGEQGRDPEIVLEIEEHRNPEKPNTRDESRSKNRISFTLREGLKYTVTAAVAVLMDLPWSRDLRKLSTVVRTGGHTYYVPPPGYGETVALADGDTHMLYIGKHWVNMGYQITDDVVPPEGPTQTADSTGIAPTAEAGGQAVG